MTFLVSILAILLLGISLRYHWWRFPITYKTPRVLMYHSISEHCDNRKKNKWRVKPEDFERQMAWFSRNGWLSCTLSELVEKDNYSAKTFCLTFDDGFEDNLTQALPILKKYRFKATIYLVTNHKTNSWEAYQDDRFVNLLNNKQIKKMLASGQIEFGSHTLSHCNLEKVSEEVAAKEIKQSKKIVEEKTGLSCKSFAYPYGKYNETIIQMVKDAGYSSAITVDRGFYENGSPFVIKRIGILGTESFFDFYLKVTRVRNKL